MSNEYTGNILKVYTTLSEIRDLTWEFIRFSNGLCFNKEEKQIRLIKKITEKIRNFNKDFSSCYGINNKYLDILSKLESGYYDQKLFENIIKTVSEDPFYKRYREILIEEEKRKREEEEKRQIEKDLNAVIIALCILITVSYLPFGICTLVHRIKSNNNEPKIESNDNEPFSSRFFEDSLDNEPCLGD